MILAQTTRGDVRARFAGSALGLAWLVLYPLLFLGAYSVAYTMIYKVKVSGLITLSTSEYVGLIFCGLIPFIGFADALGMGVGSVTGNANLIKNTLFPIELIPVKTVLASQTTQVVGLGMLLVVMGVMHRLTPFTLLLPVVWLLNFMFTMGLIWILSSTNVLLRDLQPIVTVMILILMIISPIAWTVEMVPENLRKFMGLNPLYYVIMTYQDVLFMGRFQPRIFWPFAGMSVGTFWIGWWYFARLKRVFTDNV